MENLRGFEVVSKYIDDNITFPERATSGSAGYDLAAAEDTVVPSIWQVLSENAGLQEINEDRTVAANGEYLKSTLVSTGVKAFMPENEYLMLVNRSSNPMKNHLMLPNGIGIIDSDYYDNENNEGEIFVQLINYGLEDYLIKKGDRIAQGIFTPYLTIANETNNFKKRTGGFGSSGKN